MLFDGSRSERDDSSRWRAPEPQKISQRAPALVRRWAMHHVIIPFDIDRNLWLLLTVTPAPEPLESPGVVLVAQGSRQKCEVVRTRLLDETPTLC